MKKWFLLLKDGHIGPMDISELIGQGLRNDSYVWAEGMPAWERADNVPELRNLYISVPPPPPPVTRENEGGDAAVSRTEYKAIVDGKRIGPLSKCRLAMKGLTLRTKVWEPRLPQWTEASEVPELAAMLNNEPMPGQTPPGQYTVCIMAQNGFNTTNGRLYVFDDYITLRPIRALSVMFGDYSKTGYINQYYGLEEIIGLKKGFMARKHILLTDGRKVLISANGRKFFDDIELRRMGYAEAHGLDLPPLER